jgi:hypothetical protein
MGITFLLWLLWRNFFGACALSGELFRNFEEFFSEAIMFLDLGFETLSIIVIFRFLVSTSSLLVACVPRRDLVCVLGSRLQYDLA